MPQEPGEQEREVSLVEGVASRLPGEGERLGVTPVLGSELEGALVSLD